MAGQNRPAVCRACRFAHASPHSPHLSPQAPLLHDFRLIFGHVT
jgi:hypothetical protein